MMKDNAHRRMSLTIPASVMVRADVFLIRSTTARLSEKATRPLRSKVVGKIA